MMVGILLRCRRLARLGGMITNTAKEPFVAEGEVSSKMCAIGIPISRDRRYAHTQYSIRSTKWHFA